MIAPFRVVAAAVLIVLPVMARAQQQESAPPPPILTCHIKVLNNFQREDVVDEEDHEYGGRAVVHALGG